MNDHHWEDGKRLRDKKRIDSATNTEAKDASRCSGGDFFRAFMPSLCVEPKQTDFESCIFSLFTKSVRIGSTEVSFKALESSPRDLVIEKGFRAVERKS